MPKNWGMATTHWQKASWGYFGGCGQGELHVRCPLSRRMEASSNSSLVRNPGMASLCSMQRECYVLAFPEMPKLGCKSSRYARATLPLPAIVLCIWLHLHCLLPPTKYEVLASMPGKIVATTCMRFSSRAKMTHL
jgi:hypothetical protein